MIFKPIFIPVNNIELAQRMRCIRNECREFMTRDTSYISEDHQRLWFSKLDLTSMKPFLIIPEYCIAGFGYCWNTGKETYVTGGLLPNFRGKGYGKPLFEYLVYKAQSFNNPITLEVLNTNERAINLYKKIGFVVFDRDNRITKMEYINDKSV